VSASSSASTNPRKPDVRMSSAERDAFLATVDSLVLARVGDDGFPTGAVVGCSFDDGVLRLSTDLPAGTAVCAIAERAPNYRGIKGAMVHGVLGAGGALVVGDDTATFDFAKSM
jgi:hypothetical protein